MKEASRPENKRGGQAPGALEQATPYPLPVMRSRHGSPETTGKLGGRHPARELQERERIPARFGDSTRRRPYRSLAVSCLFASEFEEGP
jgi:hypothetical protein